MSNREKYAPGPAAGAKVQKDGDKWTLVLVRELRHPPPMVWQAVHFALKSASPSVMLCLGEAACANKVVAASDSVSRANRMSQRVVCLCITRNSFLSGTSYFLGFHLIPGRQLPDRLDQVDASRWERMSGENTAHVLRQADADDS